MVPTLAVTKPEVTKPDVPTLDTAYVRSQFPAFAEPSLHGQAFFDSAGGSYACRQVIDHLGRYYRETKLQPYGTHPASRRAGEEMDLAHERLAAYLGVLTDEVHLGPSTSQNTYVLAQAFRKICNVGDEIVVTNQDHEGNSGVWRRLSDHGIVIKEWKVDPETGMLDPRDLDAILTDRTRLVAFTHCSNILGFINPVAAICARVHAAGALALVDGVSFAGHGLPDVAALGADIYLFSLYKTFGPHLGAMVIRQPTMELLGNQSHYFNQAYRRKWFVPAGPDHAQVAASGGVADYFDSLFAHHYPNGGADKVAVGKPAAVRQLLHQAERELLAPLLDFCQGNQRVRLIGPATPESRAATVSLQTHSAPPKELAERLAARGIIAGAGHFYAVRLLEAMGLSPEVGVLRLSFTHYTSESEMTQLLTALDEVL